MRLALSLFAFRLLNAFAAQSFFQPDEYFQAWEPALALVNGRGFVTWEWDAGIRTSLVPRLFALLITVAQFCNLDYLILGKIFMAMVAATADYHTAQLAGIVLGGARYKRFALALSLGSAWNWFMATRPFSNTLEMALVAAALSHWPIYRSKSKIQWGQFVLANCLAHISIALRPSNGLLWLIMGLHLLTSGSKNNRERLQVVLVAASVAAVCQYVIIAVLDAPLTNGKIPAVEFILANFGSKVSEIYGVMPWHYYLLQGIPLLLIAYLPLAAIGIYRLGLKSVIVQTILVHIVVFSLIPHKEVRFIYYILPLLHCCCAKVVDVPRWLLAVGIGANLTVALFLGMVHQRGVMDVIEHIRVTPDIQEVSFLMPCHSTPWQAHLARDDLDARFLTCTPPWNMTESERTVYVDEADQFYNDAPLFLQNHPETLLENVVVFDAAEPYPMKQLLESYGYEESARFFNSLFHEDRRRHGDVLILSRTELSNL